MSIAADPGAPLHTDHALQPPALDVARLAANLAAVRARIDAACVAAGRAPHSVALLPVSKTVEASRLRLAHAAGCRLLGENKVQEARDKAAALADLEGLQWAVIGHLQTNKAKYVARFASQFHALDSLEVAALLDRHLQAQGRSLEVFVQVNTSGESSKYGLAEEQVGAFVRALPAFASLRLRGLMTLARFSPDPALVRPCFARLRQLRDRLRQDEPAAAGLEGLSMGMSGDFELAIAEGATVVRVGQAIFGARALPDSHYWPGEGG